MTKILYQFQLRNCFFDFLKRRLRTFATKTVPFVLYNRILLENKIQPQLFSSTERNQHIYALSVAIGKILINKKNHLVFVVFSVLYNLPKHKKKPL